MNSTTLLYWAKHETLVHVDIKATAEDGGTMHMLGTIDGDTSDQFLVIKHRADTRNDQRFISVMPWTSVNAVSAEITPHEAESGT